jgi:hypothetical protein
MKFMFWNMRGFGKPARRKQIRDYISNEGLDGIKLQETMKRDFTHMELAKISGGGPFKWIWKGSKCHSWGILMGVKEDSHEIKDSNIGDHYISMVLRNMITHFMWEHKVICNSSKLTSVAVFEPLQMTRY